MKMLCRGKVFILIEAMCKPVLYSFAISPGDGTREMAVSSAEIGGDKKLIIRFQ